VRVLLALIIGIVIGAAALWFYTSKEGRSAVRKTGDQIETTTQSARDALQDKMREWNLRPEDIKNDLQRGGQVVRRKAQEAGHAIADATADARTTAAIKGKLLANRDLSALSISVNTTDGVVTLSGSVNSPGDIGKAVAVAMDTEGVREVISTLQVRAAQTNAVAR
jgi:osmotically-inducible protein OsmY